MIFNENIGIQKIKGKNLIKREAVRNISFKNGKILMLHSRRGDYKLPGGGVESNEENIEALKREVKEETGYSINKVITKLGNVIERKIDKYDDNYLFEINSKYYYSKLNWEHGKLNLTSKEEKLGMKPVWISIDTAILVNELFILKNSEDDTWTKRELLVLKIIREKYTDILKLSYKNFIS